MHRDSVGRGVHGDQQRYDIDVFIATNHVKGHRAVFTAAPTHPRSTTTVHTEMLSANQHRDIHSWSHSEIRQGI
jgi:hypothetical protein